MKPSALALRVMAGLLLIPAVCAAQWLDQVRTESDWESLYNQGYFDYNTYQLYRELAEGGSVTDSAAFFRAALGNPVLEILGNAVDDSAVADADSVNRSAFGFRLRGGQRIYADGKPSSYITFSGSRDDAAFDLKGRRGEADWEIERRSVRWGRGRAIVTLGNYDTDIGLGLGLGRFDYRPVSGIPDTSNAADDILYPENSYYNGAKVDFAGGSALFSAKRYPGLDKRFLGAVVRAIYKDVTFGLAGGGTFLSADNFDRTLGTASFFVADPNSGIRSEIAYAESGIGVAMRLLRDGFDLAAWHYDNGYLNLQSSGIARPDYVRFEDPHFPEAFRQAQAGETGLYAQKGLTAGRFDLHMATEIWKPSANDHISLDNLVSARYRLWDGIALETRLSGRSGLSNDRIITEFGSTLAWPITIQARISAWSERGEIVDSRSYCYIFCSLPLKGRIILNGRIRGYFDGDLDYFIEEALTVAEGLRLKATYRWQDSYGGATGPLYLVLEAAI